MFDNTNSIFSYKPSKYHIESKNSQVSIKNEKIELFHEIPKIHKNNTFNK